MKHSRGAQSAVPFVCSRMEKQHTYVQKVAETVVKLLIFRDKENGLIFAESAGFNTELSQSDRFDQRLQSKVLK